MTTNIYSQKATFQDFLKQEQEIKDLPVNPSKPISVDFTQTGWLNIVYSGQNFRAKLDGFIQYSIMTKMTGNKEWNRVQATWDKMLKESPDSLKTLITNLFKKNEMVIRYRDTFTGVKAIYGIVPLGYVAFDPNFFREEFKREAFARGMKYSPENSHINKFNKYVEMYIPPKKKGTESCISYMLEYGRANGISPYKINLNREIIICSNGLTSYDKIDGIYLKHKELDNVNQIICNIFQQSDIHHEILENQIAESKGRKISDSIITEFAVKQLNNETRKLFYKKLQTEMSKYENTEWALSQSLTDLATHNTLIRPDMRNVLRIAGSEVLEIGFENYLRKAA